MSAAHNLLRSTLLVLLIVLVWTPTAGAATMIDRNPVGNRVTLRVDRNNVALIEYRSKGKQRHVLAWGAVNMSRGKMRLDYSGGWWSKVAQWQTFRNACIPFDPAQDPTLGPGAETVVAACTARDGSKWAVQTWRRLMPNFGGVTGNNEIFISHWTGPVAELTVVPDWSKYASRETREHYQHIFGTLVYQGIPIEVGEADERGNPLDHKGRNIYVDSFDSTYAPGAQWSRVNSFLAQRPSGQFCYVFQPRQIVDNAIHRIAEPWLTNARSYAGDSRVNSYRATVIGPGVTPVIRLYWSGITGPFDQVLQDELEQLSIAMIGEGNKCAVQGS